MSRIIRPDQLRLTREEWEIQFPGLCPCGWYHFYYAGCGHLHRRHRYCCGHQTSVLNRRPIFCQRPAPIFNVFLVRIEGLCEGCSVTSY
ncbi:hypothetical protein QBC40DRAFT_286201 [Triangularia verruculosa]|uniref:Uncharacterized protein n=1 Tax=Triangularia verruculosa TaxID=2587418 RepID=A0AAN6XAG6_9PEZI|nr:hypothetical protein QBC40DRAFT_286201 [Triangularia verruculosa]